ncbi:hypothetical protein ACJMK2_008034 [Sinanodonta woodiana]|uniref:GOLD domain-containing protein n=1 Tax=Sinanodonta woodiana TaxID=1069815 RepID=A0ABD3VKC7_SINWO
MVTLTISCVLKCLVCFLQFKSFYSETVFGQETGEFDFDRFPWVQNEFSLEVGAGTEECLYQKIQNGINLHMSYEVLRGGDKNVNVFLKGPNQAIIDSRINLPSGAFERTASETGDYSICIDNTLSRFSSKLVHLYMVAYITSGWEKYMKEIEDVNLAVSNFSTSINTVELSINEVLKHQAGTRMQLIKDWYLITGNNSYVQYWSILHCVIFITTSVFQVYFVRRLFRSTNVTPTAKPRA